MSTLDSNLTGLPQTPGDSDVSTLDSGDMQPRLRRRAVLRAGVHMSAAALLFSAAPASAEATSDTSAASANIDMEIAALGSVVREQQPRVAASLEQSARATAGLPAAGALSWDEARRARSVLITPERIADELEAGDVLFVTGWLLSQSEAAVALLYADAAATGASTDTGAHTE